jgi:hypothetical protein
MIYHPQRSTNYFIAPNEKIAKSWIESLTGIKNELYSPEEEELYSSSDDESNLCGISIKKSKKFVKYKTMQESMNKKVDNRLTSFLKMLDLDNNEISEYEEKLSNVLDENLLEKINLKILNNTNN